jgi:PEGA domain-containing protein
VKRPALLVCLCVLFAATGSPRVAAQGKTKKASVTILPFPARDVPPSDMDHILATMAQQIRSQYRVRVLSGRAVGRSVWGTLGSGLEEAAMRFTAKVDEGKRAYQSLQVSKTIEAMREAQQHEEFCGPEIRDTTSLTDLHLYAGLALLAMGDKAKAAEEFRQAIAQNNKLTLSNKRFPPDVIEAFNSTKRRILSGDSTMVTLVSKPPGATVYIDGQTRGTTPIRATPLYAGRHFIRFQLEGYSPWTINLPDGTPPSEIKALMVPLWTGDPPEDILASGISDEQMDESVLSSMRLLAGFFRADALVLVSISKEEQDYHLGVRLFVVQPEIVSRARLFNLGSDLGGFDKKIKGVASTFKGLKRISGKTIVASNPIGDNSSGRNDYLPDPNGKKDDPIGPISTATGTKWYKSWWFWTIVGVSVAGTATGLTLWMLQPEERWTLVVQPH